MPSQFSSCLLPYKVVSITGPDSEKFLQGQMSCDISKLEDQQATFGTLNTPKGRIYLIFLIVRIEDHFLLRAHEATIDAALAVLSKYKVFFKCEITATNLTVSSAQTKPPNFDHAPAGYENIVACKPNSDQANTDYLWRCPGELERYEHWSTNATSEKNEAAAEAWHAEDCKAGIAEIYPETSEKFVLQQLNLQKLGAVSFQKGCYTGQEIIARMKFLGKLKKQSYLIEAECLEALPCNAAIITADGKKCGELVRMHAVTTRAMSVGLGIVDIAKAESQEAMFIQGDVLVPCKISTINYPE